MTRVAIYTRVSSDRAGGRSVGEQEAEARAWIAREGWILAGVWTDNDVSASRYARKARPQWQDLTTRLDRGEVDLLMVWEPSRATRDRRVWAALAATCEERGIRFGCNGRVYDLDDPEDAFQLDLMFSLATRESGQTRKRVLRSMRGNAAAGRPHGKLLYGYRREYDASSGALVAQVPQEAQAAVVREAARRVAGGQALNAVAGDLNQRGVPAPRGGTWNLTQVRRLVTNPGYIGKRVYRGAVIGDASWPSLLDEETFYTCVARLSDPRRRTVRDGAVRHLLTGLALCGVCQAPVVKQKNRGFDAYLCREGFHVSRRQDYVDKLVEGLVIERLGRPDLEDLLAGDQGGEDVRAARAEAAEKRARLEAFYDEAARGALTPAALARIEARLLPEIAAAEERARQVAVSPVLRGFLTGDPAAVWAAVSVSVRREIVRELMEVRILRARRGARTFDPETVQILWRSRGDRR